MWRLFHRPFPAPGLSAAYCQGPLCGISIVGGLHVVIAHCPRSLYNSNGKGYGTCQGTKRACRLATESHAMSVRPINSEPSIFFCTFKSFGRFFRGMGVVKNKAQYIVIAPWLSQYIVLHCFCNWFLCVPHVGYRLSFCTAGQKPALHTQLRLYLCQ